MQKERELCRSNRGQGVLQDRKFWCKYQGKEEGRVAQPRQAKVQQSSAWTGELESAAREGGMLGNHSEAITLKLMESPGS